MNEAISCDRCNSFITDESGLWRKYVSNNTRRPPTGDMVYYMFNCSSCTSLWIDDPKEYESMCYFCDGCIDALCDASWRQTTHQPSGFTYFYNVATGQRSDRGPELLCTNGKQSERPSRTAASATLQLSADLQSKRSRLFGAKFKADLSLIQIDNVAAFSVTESSIAEVISNMVVRACSAVGRDARTLTMFDGMACVGGNTMSFAKHFGIVLANELDFRRYHMLVHNVAQVCGHRNVWFASDSLLTLLRLSPPPASTSSSSSSSSSSWASSASTAVPPFHLLFLDPEWGGPTYKDAPMGTLSLTIGPMSVEQVIIEAFEASSSPPSPSSGLMGIVLKLPRNYNNSLIRRAAEQSGASYEFHDELQGMTLSILMRK